LQRGRHDRLLTRKSLYDDRIFEIVKCRRCDLVYTNPRIAFNLDAIENYQGVYDFDDPLKRGAARLQLRRIERHLPQRGGRGRLLDFGSGEGYLVHEAVRRGWEARGLEVNRHMTRVANEHWGDELLFCESLESLVRRETAGFDAIAATQVFEHLRNPREILGMLKALLKPGGVILIDVPNIECAEERRRRGASLDPTAHVYYFTQTTLGRLMRGAGLTILASRAAPSNYALYRRIFERFTGPGFPVFLSLVTDHLPLPGIGKGVYALGRRPQ
jgi:cyclopropane fatty-acyl-phospholipid synthase-like methyltransferase